jgi:hypothetical protein
MAKMVIDLHNGGSKVLQGRRGGHCNWRRQYERYDNEIDLRVRGRNDKLFAEQAVRDCEMIGTAGDIIDSGRPGLNEIMFDGNAQVSGNMVRYDGEDVSVSIVLDQNGRMLSAHCRSW